MNGHFTKGTSPTLPGERQAKKNSKNTMPYYLPDAESLEEIFGEYMNRGLRFDLTPVKPFGCYGLRVHLGVLSDVAPLFGLWPDKMETPEQAQQWLEEVRDTQLPEFYQLR
ncbi:hypothetical protein HW556_05265 [Hymenobacter sp. P5252]|uniref:Uncharacterized protein n=2 Tax=Hymenobacter terrestris TaxID=2748310 RepID=A0ABX2Q0E5_9BACT|nr:hypothetical protein [Hymenobacter terrestris]